jgi:hypothetical protein
VLLEKWCSGRGGVSWYYWMSRSSGMFCVLLIAEEGRTTLDDDGRAGDDVMSR